MYELLKRKISPVSNSYLNTFSFRTKYNIMVNYRFNNYRVHKIINLKTIIDIN